MQLMTTPGLAFGAQSPRAQGQGPNWPLGTQWPPYLPLSVLMEQSTMQLMTNPGLALGPRAQGPRAMDPIGP